MNEEKYQNIRTGDVEERPSEPDTRVLAMQRFVAAEAKFQNAQHEVDRRMKAAAIAGKELDEARAELHSLLGFGGDKGEPEWDR